MKSFLHSTSGFTLMELLVSMALLGILTGIGVTIISLINQTNDNATIISQLQTQGSQAVEGIEKAVRSSSEAMIVASNTGGCGAEYNYCLRLRLSNGSLEWTATVEGCDYAFYAYKKPDYTGKVNGTVTKYYRYANLNNATLCGGGANSIFVNTTTAANAISVEEVGSTPLFVVSSGTSGVPYVALSMNLYKSVVFKPASGTDTRISVPFTRQINLRTY